MREGFDVERIGFHTTYHSLRWGSPAPLTEVVAAAAAGGFDVIGVDLESVAAAVRDGTSLAAVAALVAEAGLLVSDVVSLRVTGDRADDRERATAIARVGAALGCPTCVVAIPRPLPVGRLRTVLGTCADVLANAGMRFGLEPVSYFAMADLDDARRLCAWLGRERAGLVLDSLHLARSGTPVAAVAELHAEDVALVQLADAPAKAPLDLVAESRHGRLLPGDGALPLAGLVAALRSIGYRGPYQTEVLSARLRGTPPAEVAAMIRRALEDLLGRARPEPQERSATWRGSRAKPAAADPA